MRFTLAQELSLRVLNRLSGTSIGMRVYALVSLVIVLSVVGIVTLGYWQAKNDVLEDQYMYAKALTASLMDLGDLSLRGAIDQLNSLIVSRETEALRRAFNGAPLASRLDEALFLKGLDVWLEADDAAFRYMNGDMIGSDEPVLVSSGFIASCREDSEVAMYGHLVKHASNEWVLPLCIHKRDFYDQVIGTFVAYLGLNVFHQGHLSRLSESGQSRVLLLDPSGRVIFSSAQTYKGGEEVGGALAPVWTSDHDVTGMDEFHRVYLIDGVPSHVFIQRDNGTGWLAVYLLDATAVTNVLDALLKKAVLVAGVVLILALMLSMRMVHNIVRPISTLIGQMDRAAEGLSVDLSPCAHEAKEIIELRGHFERMVSEVKKRQAELHGKNELLVHAIEAAERASEAKSVFLGRMSHELRTPLNAILGFARLLKAQAERDQLSARYLNGLANIELGGNRLLGMVNQVFTYVTLSSSTAPLDGSPCDLCTLAQMVIRDKTGIARECEKTISISLPDDDSLWASADPARLREVLEALLDNALFHSGPEAEVRVAVSADQTHCRICVSDTGVGIPDQDQERIFKPFERLDMAEQNEIQGAGMGLAVAHLLVQKMGGTLVVESVPGKGATFLVTLKRIAPPGTEGRQ